MIELDLQIASAGQHPDLQQLQQWCAFGLRPRSADSELTIRLVDEAEGRELNHTWRQKDYATNVLSFPYETEPVVLGDLVICAPVVAREAGEQGKTLEAHFAHLVVHGMLHLQGYDHEAEADALVMEKLETDILRGLGYADPYA